MISLCRKKIILSIERIGFTCIQMDNSTMHGMNGGYGATFGLEGNTNGGAGDGGTETNGENGAGEGPKYSDINLILDQILTMSDQNIDEAQVLRIQSAVEVNVMAILYFMWSRRGSTPSTVTE